MTKLRIPDRSFYPAPLGSILSIWAHPDDETYLAGGVMAAARDRGQRVVCVSATAGENGTPDPEAWPPARLGEVRRWEAAAAMAVLGVDEHRIADFPDGDLTRHTERGVAWVADLIDEVEPDTILTFGSDGITFHPDHIAVHEWVTRAWEDRNCRARLLYATPTVRSLEDFAPLYERWGVYMTDDRPNGVAEEDAVVHVALSGHQLDRKMTALRAMATQTGGAIEMLGDATYADLVAEEAFVAVDAARGQWGSARYSSSVTWAPGRAPVDRERVDGDEGSPRRSRRRSRHRASRSRHCLGRHGPQRRHLPVELVSQQRDVHDRVPPRHRWANSVMYTPHLS